MINTFFFFIAFIARLTTNTQERPYHTVDCYSAIEGWIRILVNKQQYNDQSLYIYHPGGLGPSNLVSHHLSIGSQNTFSVQDDGKIALRSKFTGGLELIMEYSSATLKSSNGNFPLNYQSCYLR